MKHLITDIQRFCLTDGPGIRTTVFLKGCNMRCEWCHNPETLSFSEELMFYPEKCIGCGRCFEACPNGVHRLEDGRHLINRARCVGCGKCASLCYAEALVMIGKEMTVDEIMREVRADTAFYEESGGGVTISGGEVLCHLPLATALADACHREGISVALETNLSLPYEQIAPLLEKVDLLIADMKLFDDALHRRYTGVSSRTVIENIQKITDIPMIVRTPLIPGVTATEDNLKSIAALLKGKKNLIFYQLLNFNPLGASKYASLGRESAFKDARPYTDEELARFGALLSDADIKVKVGE